MKPRRTLLRDGLVPLGVFTAVAAAHYFWTTRPAEAPAAESMWVSLPAGESSRLSVYLKSGAYWLAYSYGLSFAFAAEALRRYLRTRTAAGGGFALGGVTFSGLLAFFGCYLTGCCGSPMLVVYLNLFGAGFLPFAKPFIAGLTTLSVVGAWWWMAHRDGRRGACCSSATPCCR